MVIGGNESGTSPGRVSFVAGEAGYIWLSGPVVPNVSSDYAIVAATGLTTAMVRFNTVRVESSTGADVAITANPQIADGIADGHRMLIQGTSIEGVHFADGNGMSLDGGVGITVELNDMLYIMYDSGEDLWCEISRVDD